MSEHAKRLVVSVFVFFLVLTGSSFAYHYVEGWSMIDSIYFVVISATTIGYGDITPATSIGKLITILFSFFWIAFAFYYVSLISSYVFKRYLERKRIEKYTPHTYKKSGPKKRRAKRK